VWGDAFSRPLTQDFEITTLENPLTLGPGGKTRLLVTLDGAPVKGAAVSYDGETRGVTGEDGRVNIKIRHAGYQVIQAGISVPLGSDEADETVYTTNLNFEIGETK
jgi:nickel transport protein